MKEDRELNPPENTNESHICLKIVTTYGFNSFKRGKQISDTMVINNLDHSLEDIRSWIADEFDMDYTCEEVDDLMGEGYLKVIYDGEESRYHFEEEELWN